MTTETPGLTGVAEALAAYDAAARTAARAQGRPTVRRNTSLRGVNPSAFVFAHSSGRYLMRDRKGVGPLDIERLMAKVTQVASRDFKFERDTGLIGDDSIVFDDTDTIRAVRGIVDTEVRIAQSHANVEKADALGALGRQLDLALSANTLVLASLADLLTDAFWWHADTDPAKFVSWREALAPNDAPGAAIERLWDALPDPHHSAASIAAYKMLVRRESAALHSATYSGVVSACSQFKALEDAIAAREAHAALDDGLLARNMMSGAVCALTVTELSGDKFRAELSLPLRLDPGKRVHIFSPGKASTFDATLSEVVVTGGGLAGEFTFASRYQGDLQAARTANRPVYAALAPFDMPRFFKGSKWTGKPPEEGAPVPAKRDVPLDVIFAGSD